MALPALLDTCTTWVPGDPLYPPPPTPEPGTDRYEARLHADSVWAMRWVAEEAVPAPWGWLCGEAARPAVRR